MYLGETYPDLVDVIEIGQSSQGRPIKLVKIGRQIRETRTKNKKSILIDAGSTVLIYIYRYILNSLTKIV